MWQIFSIYTIPTTFDYLKISFNSDEDYLDFINLISSRNVYDFLFNPTVNDKILTLSSCYQSSNRRLVIHAKLIKGENRQIS